MWNEMPEWVWYVLLILRFCPGCTPGSASNAPLFVSHNLACNYAAGTRIKTLHELLHVCVYVCFYFYVCVCYVCDVSALCQVPELAEIWIRFWIPRFLLHQHLMAVCASNLAVLRLNLDSREFYLILIWFVLDDYKTYLGNFNCISIITNLFFIFCRKICSCGYIYQIYIFNRLKN